LEKRKLQMIRGNVATAEAVLVESRLTCPPKTCRRL
jgi:hypothetical protein